MERKKVSFLNRMVSIILPICEGFDFLFNVAENISFEKRQVCWVALIKRTQRLESLQPLSQQMNFFLFPSGYNEQSIYEILHGYIHHAVSPLFNAYISSKMASSEIADFGSKLRDDKDNRLG